MFFLRLIRLPNLVIVALTQYLLQGVLRQSINQNTAIKLVLNDFQFFIFVFATMLVTGAGYVINDIYDIEIDAHNKPATNQIVGRKISKRNAYILYFFLIALSGLLSVEVALAIHHIEQLWLFPTFVFGLWWYAAQLKKSFLLGNLFVASFCASVAWIIFYAQNLNIATLENLGKARFKHLELIFQGYFVLAFISTLLREVIKDTEDAEGDAAFGARTVPIVLGVTMTKFICYALIFSLMATTIYFGNSVIVHETQKVLWQCTNLFSLNLGFLAWKARTKQDWHRASQFAKLVMLVGLTFILLLL